MQASNSPALFFLSPRQRYRANSFDLGFINVEPIDLIIEVTSACSVSNELLLAPLPVTGDAIHPTLILIARWFQEVYPSLPSERCMMKNVQAFGRLVELEIIVPEQDPAMPPAPASLLTTIQQQT